MGYIYKITNLITKDFYIGQTISTLAHRFNQHKSYANSSNTTILANAIRKYGSDNFIIEALEECSEEQLDNRETYYIQLLHPKYNIKQSATGRIPTTWNNSPITMYQLDGTKVQNFDSMLDAGRFLINHNKTSSKNPYDLVAHISDVCNQKRQSAYGYQWRYSEDNAILSPIAVHKQGYQHSIKAIFPDNTIHFFNSQVACADYLINNNLLSGSKKAISTGISNCCLGKRLQYKSYYFEYVNASP